MYYKRTVFIIEIPEYLLLVSGDEERLRQVITNLLDKCL
jgi:signal transduction histidine kinase